MSVMFEVDKCNSKFVFMAFMLHGLAQFIISEVPVGDHQIVKPKTSVGSTASGEPKIEAESEVIEFY